MPVHTTTSPPARPLADILDDARLAACGHCLQVPGLPCTTHPGTGARGVHVGRVAAAYRCGLISGPEVAAALAVPDAFTTATVIWTDGAS